MQAIRSAWHESRAFRIAVQIAVTGALLAAMLGNPAALAVLILFNLPRRQLLAALNAAS